VSLSSKVSFSCCALVVLCGACASQHPITKLVGGHQITTRSIDAEAYEHVSRAFLYEEQERWKDAIAEMQRALNFDSDSPELHAYLSELYLRAGDEKKAEEEAHASLAIVTTVDGLVAKAHVLRARGDVAAEVEALRRARNEVDFAAEDDDAEAVYLELAEAELHNLDLPAAQNTLEALTQAEPESASGHMRLTAVYWATGAMAKAEATLHTALAEEPNQIEALAALAWIHAALGKNEEAKNVFHDAVDRSEGAPEIAAAFARFLVGLGDTKEAEQVADDLAVPESSLDADTLPGHVELERSAHRYDRALALLAHAREAGLAEDEKTRLSLSQAAILKDEGKSDEALAALKSVAKDSPLFFESRLRAAELLRDAGKVDEGMRIVEEAKGQAKGDKDAIEIETALSLALSEEKRGDAKAAVERLEPLFHRHPDESRLVLLLASIEERRGNWRHALDLAEGYLGKNRGSVEALNFWGFVAADHDYALDLARKRLQVACSLDPGSGGLIDSLGWLHFRAKDLTQASLFLEQAARLEPADAEIQWHVGELYAEKKSPEKAAAAYRRGLGFKPDERVRHKLEDSLAKLAGGKASGQK
jgi:Tfp pilus assembly protein PilF